MHNLLRYRVCPARLDGGGKARPIRKCSIEGCERKHYGNGLCSMHWFRVYHRKRREGKPDLRRTPRPKRLCSIEGCGRSFYGKGLCKIHYMRKRLGCTDMRPELMHQYIDGICSQCGGPLIQTQHQIKNGGSHKCRFCLAAQKRSYPLSPEARERKNARTRERRRINAVVRQKAMTRAAVARAINRKELKRHPCIICSAPNTEAHHEDHSKPFGITWLCHEHHLALHYPQRVRKEDPHA